MNLDKEESSLLDTFAARTMQAWITAAAYNDNAEAVLKRSGILGDEVESFIAKCSYDMAEAMITERRSRSPITSSPGQL